MHHSDKKSNSKSLGCLETKQKETRTECHFCLNPSIKRWHVPLHFRVHFHLTFSDEQISELLIYTHPLTHTHRHSRLSRDLGRDVEDRYRLADLEGPGGKEVHAVERDRDIDVPVPFFLAVRTVQILEL